MQYLVDTGILLRLFDRSDPHHPTIKDTLRTLRIARHGLVTCPQNIAEFWNVSTRPTSARGGYGHTPQLSDRRVAFIERNVSILPESHATYREWRRLVLAHNVQGVAVHDARLVAAMITHGVSTMITLNVPDFTRYRNIQALSPEEVLASLSAQ